jgi:hypothetical protein
MMHAGAERTERGLLSRRAHRGDAMRIAPPRAINTAFEVVGWPPQFTVDGGRRQPQSLMTAKFSSSGAGRGGESDL